MKHLLKASGALLLAALLGCARPQAQPESRYCNALAAGTSTNAVNVTHLHIYGDMQHGTVAISPECPRLVSRFAALPVSDATAITPGAKDLIMTVYSTLSTKSGMYEFDGLVNVVPKDKLVILVDVDRLREVDNGEADTLLRESSPRKQ